MAPVPDSLRDALRPYMLQPRAGHTAAARTSGALAAIIE
jgi:hypothetical protein